jgi:hypothetical protein
MYYSILIIFFGRCILLAWGERSDYWKDWNDGFHRDCTFEKEN